MRILAALLLLMAALWSGAWFAAARIAERAAETWFAEAAADGLLAGYDHLAVSGYPFRLSLRIEAPRLADPLTGSGWAGDAAAAALSLAAPDRLRLRPEGVQTLWTPVQRIEVTAAALGLDVLLRGLPPEPAALEWQGAGLRLTGAAHDEGPGWGLGIANAAGQVGLRGTEPALTATLGGIAIDIADWPEEIAPIPAGPIRALELAARAIFAAPVEAGGRLQAVEIAGLTLDWGATRFTAAGRLEIGADGFPQGRIVTTTADWRPLLALAVATGLVAPELAPTWLRVVETLAAAGPEAARAAGALELPVVFNRGRISLGPLPLGAAPRLAPPLPPGG